MADNNSNDKSVTVVGISPEIMCEFHHAVAAAAGMEADDLTMILITITDSGGISFASNAPPSDVEEFIKAYAADLEANPRTPVSFSSDESVH